MIKKQQRLQFFLILVGLFLIAITYFYFPNLTKESKIQQNKNIQDEVNNDPTDEQFSTFENVVYEGLYDLDKPFSVQSKKAYMLNDEPDIVYMTDMHVILYLKDGRTVDILSNKGRYNKMTHDCYFEENVRVTDKETKIFSENLDLLATENFVKAYNKVKLNHPTGTVKADQIDYDFEKKYFKVSMFGEKVVKMKVTN